MSELSLSLSNVLLLGSGWFPTTSGGLNRYVYELSNTLVQQQTFVELCGVGLPSQTLDDHWLLTNLAEPDMPLPQRLWLTRRNFIHRQIQQPQAINLHFALYSLPVLSCLPEVPVTFTFHGPWAIESELEDSGRLGVWAKQWMEQRVYRQCDRFIVLSQAFGKILQEQYGVAADSIRVIPGGVDTERFTPSMTRQEARTQLNWPQDRLVLFTPRRLVHRMGIDRLITAIAKIRSRHPDVWLAIAGKGRLRTDLEQQVLELEASEHVHFLGFLPDEQLPLAYQAADLTVIPSRALEGFGLVLLESLACGTPVMCTPVGGMPEILADFSPELITESTAVDAIASRLQDCLGAEHPLPDRQSCRDYAVDNFNWPKIAQQVQQTLLA